MIKVLHVIDSISAASGMMSVVMNYNRFINHDEVQFDFLYFLHSAEDYKQEITQLGGKIYFMEKPSLKPSFHKALHDFFRTHAKEYQIIHCHPIWSAMIFGRAARQYGITHVVAHSHSTMYGNNRLSSMRNRVMVHFFPHDGMHYAACSRQAAMLFGKKAAQMDDLYIVTNAIDYRTYYFSQRSRQSIREQYGIPQDTLVLGHVGRFSAEKNHPFLIDLLEALPKKQQNAVLMLVGDGAVQQDIEHLVKQKTLDCRVIFTGRRSDVGALLSAMDVFVLPSFYEGVPVSAIEAQVSGLPCLLSDTITREIETDGCQYFSLHTEPAQTAELLLKLVHKKTDRASTAGQTFHIETQACRLEQYYREMADHSLEGNQS